jgi:hypothetical protein
MNARRFGPGRCGACSPAEGTGTFWVRSGTATNGLRTRKVRVQPEQPSFPVRFFSIGLVLFAPGDVLNRNGYRGAAQRPHHIRMLGIETADLIHD